MRWILLLLLIPLDLLGQTRISVSPIRVVQTLADLDNLPPNVDAPIVRVMGFSQPKDWGELGREFYYDRTNALATNTIRRAVRGGVGRWVHDCDLVDVRLFGAIADGNATADNVAIQAAQDYATANRKPLYFPPTGTNWFRLDGVIYLDSGARVIGEDSWIRVKDGSGPEAAGIGATLFRNRNFTETTEANFDPITTDRDIVIEGIGKFVLDGNGHNMLDQFPVVASPPGASAPVYNTMGLRFYSVNGLQLKNLTIVDIGLQAVTILGCKDFLVSGCTISNAFSSFSTNANVRGKNNDGLAVLGSQRGRIVNNQIWSTDDCIAVYTYASNSRDITIANNVLYQMVTSSSQWTPRVVAIATGYLPGRITENITVANNVGWAGTGSGIIAFTITPTNYVTLRNIKFLNNIITASGEDRATTHGNIVGAYVDGARGVDYIGNTFSNFTGRLFWLRKCSDINVDGNTFVRQNRQTFDSMSYGAYLDTSAGDISNVRWSRNLLKDAFAGISSFTVTNYAVSNLVVENSRFVNIESNATAIANSSLNAAVHIFNGRKIDVRNNQFEHIGSTAISYMYVQDGSITDNEIDGSDIPILISAGARLKITGNRIRNQTLETGISDLGGVYVWPNYGQSSDVTFKDNIFENLRRGGIYSPVGGLWSNIVVSGNIFRRGANDIGTTNSLALKYAAVSMVASKDVEIENNTVQDWGAAGVYVSLATNVFVSGNAIRRLGSASITDAHGINIAATDATVASDFIDVIGNRVAECAGIGINLQSPRRWNISGNNTYNNSWANTSYADVFIDVNGATTQDTAGFSGSIIGNTVFTTNLYAFRGQVRNLPAGVNSGQWNGNRWSVVGNNARSANVLVYNWNPVLNAVGTVEGSPVWRTTIPGSGTVSGDSKIMEYFGSSGILLTLPSANSMRFMPDFTIFKAAANTAAITTAVAVGDVINLPGTTGVSSFSWTNAFRGYRFRCTTANVWNVEVVE